MMSGRSFLKLVITFAFIAAFSLPSGASADFYKYVDSDGVMHLSNVPTSDKYRWFMSEAGSRRKEGSKGRADYVSYDELIGETSRKYGVEGELVKAIIKAESDFDPGARSEDGAMGLMQLMPETMRLMGVKDAYDPAENIRGGVMFLNYLLGKFPDVSLAVAAYNAGENAVVRHRGIPPYAETINYVKQVLKYRNAYRKANY